MTMNKNTKKNYEKNEKKHKKSVKNAKIFIFFEKNL